MRGQPRLSAPRKCLRMLGYLVELNVIFRTPVGVVQFLGSADCGLGAAGSPLPVPQAPPGRGQAAAARVKAGNRLRAGALAEALEDQLSMALTGGDCGASILSLRSDTLAAHFRPRSGQFRG